jgi:hypothetical protein
VEQQELLIQAQRLGKDDHQRLIAQARALADLAEYERQREIDEVDERIPEKNSTQSVAEMIVIENWGGANDYHLLVGDKGGLMAPGDTDVGVGTG